MDFCKQHAKRTAILLAGLFTLIVSPVAAFDVHHDLRIVLDPVGSRLEAVDTLTIGPAAPVDVVLQLSNKATGLDLKIDGGSAAFTFDNGRLRLKTGKAKGSDPIRISLAYTAVFDDPVPVMPANTDNPGYGVSATISPQGTLLLFGAGWYPHIDAERVTFSLNVEAPAGVIAVTAGRSLGHRTDGDRTFSAWVIDHPVRGLSLSAARFQVREESMGRVTAATYLLPQSADLSEAYLAATGRYLQLYESLFGPYPFDKFAVVENFFPTGFGFPSYTLLGSQVLRLPFIIDTSLGHEIAHCWWGNGVFVDFSGGNWSEGLTTYVADYLYTERGSDEAGRAYRQQILRNYAALVSPPADFPVNRFKGRSDPVTKTIGYDKSAMIFHMLRRHLGEEAFWGALRDIYREYLFRTASWDDLRHIFERRAGKPLDDFFEQWVRRAGAPRLGLENVTANASEGGWRVRGEIVQQLPVFSFEADLSLRTEGHLHNQRVRVSGHRTPFELRAADRPLVLEMDPGTDIFRRLEPEEIPPSVNAVKGATSVLVILSADATPVLRAAAETLVAGLGLVNFRMVRPERVHRSELEKNDLLFVGYPAEPAVLAEIAGKVTLARHSFVLDETGYADPGDAFFGVFRHPFAPGRSAAVFLPISDRSADTVARRVTHYGKYSYLAFSEGQNRAKGTWPVTASPLTYAWPQS